MEQYPVIFVNRYDAVEYARWRSKQDGRANRLPTRTEFEYAARAGSEDKRYAWGDSLPQKVNYDASGRRTFDQWRQFLKPAGQTPPNRWGVRDLAGNVWQNSQVFD